MWGERRTKTVFSFFKPTLGAFWVNLANFPKNMAPNTFAFKSSL